MTITVGGSNITFNDSTTQSTAFAGSFVNGQVFTSSGTFTIPSGVTGVKVTILGGGANGGGAVNGAYNGGYGVGAGGLALSYLTGLTPSATIAVTVGGGGGGQSKISSGNQSISTVTANGGSTSNGGTASGGSLNVTGANETFIPTYICASAAGGSGGNSQYGGGGAGGISGGGPVNGTSANGYGAGGGGGATNNNSNAGGGNGTQGLVIFEW